MTISLQMYFLFINIYGQRHYEINTDYNKLITSKIIILITIDRYW